MRSPVSNVLRVIFIVAVVIGVYKVVSGKRESFRRFNTAVEWSNLAKDIPLDNITDADRAKLVRLLARSLEDAMKVKIRILNSRYAGFGDHFRKEFIPSVELMLDYLDNDNEDSRDASIDLQAVWGRWYNSHRDRLK